MNAILWLLLLILAAIGIASIVDYTGAYDVPMIEVSKQVDASASE